MTLIEIEFRMEMHDGGSLCQGQGATLEEAVKDAKANAFGPDFDECRDFSVTSVSIDGRGLVMRDILGAIASYSDFENTGPLVSHVRDYQQLLVIEKEAVPMMDALR